MEKNPFSLYDFLGYVFPGMFALYLISIFYQNDDMTSIHCIIGNIKFANGDIALKDTVIIIIASYIMGHLIAYLSSITVEKFSIWMYGYPSYFLLNHEKKEKYGEVKRFCWLKGYYAINEDDLKKEATGYNKKKVSVIYILRTLIFIFLLPISVTSILIGKRLRVDKFFIKTLDEYLIKVIKAKKNGLMKRLGNEPHDKNDYDFHRIIYHYVYEKMKTHNAKLDNYVALYGFLRSVALIFNILFLYIIYKSFYTISLSDSIDWYLIKLLILLLIITYLFFMGFMKFYRRFTLESFMCLVVDEEI